VTLRLPEYPSEAQTLFWLAEQIEMHASINTLGASGFVYFATDNELVKIGFSAAPAVRVKKLKSTSRANKDKVRLLGQARGCMGHERLFHGLFWEHWCEGEWFAVHPDLMKAIELAKDGMCAERILLHHVGRRREPFSPPRFGPANRSPCDYEVVETVKGGVYSYEHIPHPKGSLPRPVWVRGT